jgi:ATP/maltotriose-dependent transcriptional regulator MalT
VQLFKAQLAHYRGHKEAAVAMATLPLGALPENVDVARLAAWTVVASVLLNLDEILTKG